MSAAFRPLAVGALVPALAAAQAPSPLPPPPLLTLPGLADLLAEARRANPDLLRVRALLEAERAKAGPAGALPDPDLSVGVLRAPAMDVMLARPSGHIDVSGLSAMLPARTEYSLMASQGLPWPGRPGP